MLLSFYTCRQRCAYVLLGSYGALHYQGTQNLNSSKAFEISIATPIKYMRCYATVFFYFLPFIINPDCF